MTKPEQTVRRHFFSPRFLGAHRYTIAERWYCAPCRGRLPTGACGGLACGKMQATGDATLPLRCKRRTYPLVPASSGYVVVIPYPSEPALLFLPYRTRLPRGGYDTGGQQYAHSFTRARTVRTGRDVRTATMTEGRQYGLPPAPLRWRPRPPVRCRHG